MDDSVHDVRLVGVDEVVKAAAEVRLVVLGELRSPGLPVPTDPLGDALRQALDNLGNGLRSDLSSMAASAGG